MLKYNSKYAQLIGKQKSNVDKIEEFVIMMPHLELIDNIRKDIHGLDLIQNEFTGHFKQLKSKIAEAAQDFLSVRQSNGGEIIDENFSREQAHLQLAIE